MNNKSFLCVLSVNEIKKLKKTPHNIHYFCNNYNNIINCKKDNCDNKKGYNYNKQTGILYKNSNIQKKNIIKYFKKKQYIELLNNVKFIKYMDRGQRPSTTLHWGQLKLFLSTMQFLLYYAPINKEVHVIYVGSSPGTNIQLLTKFFPQCKWYLIDPRKHCTKLQTNKKIICIKQQYCNNKYISNLKKKLKDKYIFYISDIRSTTDEQNIYNDNKCQMCWYYILQPEYSQLKFRIPRINSTYRYLDGKIYIQMYAAPATTETRLVVKKNAKTKIYNVDQYEGKCYYHNRINRVSYYKQSIKKYGLDNCYDCTGFVNLIKKYKKKYRNTKSIENIIKFIIYNLNNDLKLKKKKKKLLENFTE